MKIRTTVRLCEPCRLLCAAEMRRRGMPTKSGVALDEETSHAMTRLVCDACLKTAGLARIPPG